MDKNIIISNLFWCIIGIIGGGITSYFISFHFHLISKNRKRLLYYIKTDRPKSHYSFGALSHSHVIIENRSKSYIEKNDFILRNPLSIYTYDLVLDKDKIHIFQINNVNWTLKDYSEENPFMYLIDFDIIPVKGIISFSIFHSGEIGIYGDFKNGTICKYKKRKFFAKGQLLCIIIVGAFLSLLGSLIYKIFF